jgi:hypothetical protein
MNGAIYLLPQRIHRNARTMGAAMSDFMSSSIERELQRDERLLWKGRPRGGIRFRGSDAYLIPFSLLWGGIAISWEFAAIAAPKKDATEGFPLFGLLFVFVGLYLIFGRFFVDARMRAGTEYGLTNRRAIIVSGFFSRTVKSIDLKSTSEITLTEKADRSGTITFGAAPAYGRMQYNPWFPGGSSAQPAFEMIEDARSVYGMIEEARGR